MIGSPRGLCRADMEELIRHSMITQASELQNPWGEKSPDQLERIENPFLLAFM